MLHIILRDVSWSLKQKSTESPTSNFQKSILAFLNCRLGKSLKPEEGECSSQDRACVYVLCVFPCLLVKQTVCALLVSNFKCQTSA